MSYNPVRCPNGCGDLPVRVFKAALKILSVPREKADEPLMSVFCRKCKNPRLLTARDLGLTLPVQ